MAESVVGPWAADKLDRLGKYLSAYTTIMKDQDWCERFYYIDAMAGRLPEDLPEIIQRRASEMPKLLREASGLTPAQLEKVQEQIRKLKEKGDK